MDYKDFITSALMDASQIANGTFGKVSGITKEGDNNQVLTETDIAIGKMLVSRVQEVFPEYNIIDEEAGVVDNHSEFTWVIDPIDGTSNFANGVPTFGIMIGLLQQNAPIVGGIALPFFKELYFAEKNKGSYCNGERIFVTKENRLLSCLVAYGIDGHQENPELTYEESRIFAEIVLKVRNIRSSNSVYDYALVAKGNYGAQLNKTSKIWDNVAPQLLIEEAGGIYTDFDGNPLDYTHPLEKAKDNFSVCAGAPALHQQLQEIIHKE